SEDTPMVTTEAAINLIKRDGKWLIAADNDELGNAVTGGAVDYFDKLFGPAEKENEDVEEEEAAYIQLTEYGVGEPITGPSSALTRLFGQPELKGEIVVTIDNYEFTSAIEDAFTFRGTYEPRGTFLVVVYSVTNELNVEIQPSTQISNEVYITDARGRRWEKADYTVDYGGISGSAAVARDHRQPEEFVPPGFTNTTAVVFDLPPNATDGLALVWEEAGIRIPLGAD